MLSLFSLPLPASDTRHLGPVTDILVFESEVFSVSQAGIVVQAGARARLIVNPSLRVLALCRESDRKDSRLLFAGGHPGSRGHWGWITTDPRVQAEPVVSEIGQDLLHDLDSSLDSDGSTKGLAAAASDGKVWVQPDRRGRWFWEQRHAHTAAATSVAFSPDGRWLASAGLDGVVMISATDAGPEDEPRQLLDHTAGVECLAWSPDSKFLASGSRDSKVRLHEAGGKLIRTYNGLGMEEEPVAGRVDARVLALAWNAHALVAGTSKGTLYRLSLEDDTVTKLAREGDDPVYALAFGPEGELLVGGHGRLQILNINW